MKKLVMVFALGAILGSCGKSACDCQSEGAQLLVKIMGETDKDKVKELNDEAEALSEECKDYDKKDFEACN